MLLYDPTYFLVLIGFILAAFASTGVQNTFRKYSDVKNAKHLTADAAARKILDDSGLYNVSIERIRGNLTDHYDPRAKVVRLSDSTYGSDSVAAIGVAAHEAGHAVQHAVGYAPIKVRNAIVPAVNICSRISMPLFVLGIILGEVNLANIGIILFSAAFVFQIITLPVEFNASRRALKILKSGAMLDNNEIRGARKVLTAAAMTYVASALASALQLLRLVLINNSRRRD